MKWLIIYFLFNSSLAAHADGEAERFHALRRARSVAEFEAVRRRFDLLEAATLACEKEMSGDRVPVNCYVALKIKKTAPGLALNKKCEESAAQADYFVHREHLRLLPAGCLRQVRLREKLLAYKAGKEIE